MLCMTVNVVVGFLYILSVCLQPVPLGPSSIENDAHGIEKLLLKTQVS